MPHKIPAALQIHLKSLVHNFLSFCVHFSWQEEEKQRLTEELAEAKDKARRRSMGNIKFIGELFKLKMLTEVIMHDCIVKLLKNHDEESLECLCRLLSTIGKDLDFAKAKVQNSLLNEQKFILQAVFCTVPALVNIYDYDGRLWLSG